MEEHNLPVMPEVKIEIDVAEELLGPWMSRECLQALQKSGEDNMSRTETGNPSDSQAVSSDQTTVLVKQEPTEDHVTNPLFLQQQTDWKQERETGSLEPVCTCPQSSDLKTEVNIERRWVKEEPMEQHWVECQSPDGKTAMKQGEWTTGSVSENVHGGEDGVGATQEQNHTVKQTANDAAAAAAAESEASEDAVPVNNLGKKRQYQCPKCPGVRVQKLARHLRTVHHVSAKVAKTWRYIPFLGGKMKTSKRQRVACPYEGCIAHISNLGRHLKKVHQLAGEEYVMYLAHGGSRKAKRAYEEERLIIDYQDYMYKVHKSAASVQQTITYLVDGLKKLDKNGNLEKLFTVFYVQSTTKSLLRTIHFTLSSGLIPDCRLLNLDIVCAPISLVDSCQDSVVFDTTNHDGQGPVVYIEHQLGLTLYQQSVANPVQASASLNKIRAVVNFLEYLLDRQADYLTTVRIPTDRLRQTVLRLRAIMKKTSSVKKRRTIQLQEEEPPTPHTNLEQTRRQYDHLVSQPRASGVGGEKRQGHLQWALDARNKLMAILMTGNVARTGDVVNMTLGQAANVAPVPGRPNQVFIKIQEHKTKNMGRRELFMYNTDYERLNKFINQVRRVMAPTATEDPNAHVFTSSSGTKIGLSNAAKYITKETGVSSTNLRKYVGSRTQYLTDGERQATADLMHHSLNTRCRYSVAQRKTINRSQAFDRISGELFNDPLSSVAGLFPRVSATLTSAEATNTTVTSDTPSATLTSAEATNTIVTSDTPSATLTSAEATNTTVTSDTPSATLTSLTFDTPGVDTSLQNQRSRINRLSLDKLLAMMVRLHCRPASTAASTTFFRLVSCFTPTDSLTEQHINQLMGFLTRDLQPLMKEACLKVLERLLAVGLGWMLVSRMDLVDKVIELVGHSSQPSMQVVAMAVLDQLLNVPELDYAEIRGKLENDVYPSVFNCLHSKAPLNVKYAACCIVRTLARDADFAARIKKESLFLLRQLRDSSARLREAYVGVLMVMFAHPGLTEPGSVDTGILPVVKGLLRDGPCETQKQALALLHCVMCDERGVEAVTGDQRIVAYVTACLLTSDCRKVRTQACLVSTTLTSVHRVGVARAILEGISHYVQPEQGAEAGVGGGRVARVTYPVPAKNLAETHTWHNFDCFLDSVNGLLHSEGLLVLELDHIYSELPVKGEISMVQLSCLSYLLQLVVNMCTWPLQRRAVGFGNAQVAKLDLTHLCNDLSVREKFSVLNHRMAVQQWKRFGHSIFAILRWMSQRINASIQNTKATVGSSSGRAPQENSSLKAISRPASAKPASAKPSSAPVAKEFLSEAEWVLLHSLLNLLLCMTLVSCKKISALFSDKDSPRSSPSMSSLPVKKKPASNGLWVSENPHLTQSNSHGGSLKTSEELSQKQQEDLEKEAMSNRRKMRREMYNEGLFALLGPLVQLGDPEVKTMCGLILRAAVQPLEEKVRSFSTQAGDSTTGSASYVSVGHAFGPLVTKKRRPQSAVSMGSTKTDKTINIALHRMSPSSASVVQEALGMSSQSTSTALSGKRSPTSRQPAPLVRAASAKDVSGLRPDSVVSATSSQRSNTPLSSARLDSPALEERRHSPPSRLEWQQNLRPLVPGQPINKECQREAVEQCGIQAIQSLFCPSHRMKLYSLLFLHDLVKFATVEIHMELSKRGIIPKLLDFIRVNDDNEQLEILGLRVIKILCASDARLRHLFSHHGGHTLLTALTKNSNVNIREQVRATLAAVTMGQRFGHGGQRARGQRPSSAPVHRRDGLPIQDVGQPNDIWDHIMHRWEEEDKVVKVLQKYM